MKRLIQGGLRCGKTTKAVEIAIKTGAYIVVKDRAEALRLSQQYPELRFPVTWAEILDSRMRGSFVKKIVIDDLDRCVASMFPVSIEAVTMSTPLDRVVPNKELLRDMREKLEPRAIERMLHGRWNDGDD